MRRMLTVQDWAATAKEGYSLWRIADRIGRSVPVVCHAALTLATNTKAYFAHPRSPWERGTTESTSPLIREYLPTGTQITTHQPHLSPIAEELNERPRTTLGWLTPREAHEGLLAASTT